MAVTRRDYHVQFRREETIADVAQQWREAAGNANFSFFNIVEFAEKVLSTRIKGGLRICFFDMDADGYPAYVDYTPATTLHVDRDIWHLAKIGEPKARFIIAHEIGHIVLHDNRAKAFSDDPDSQIKYSVKENSAEWQANTFAEHFLMPTRVAAAYDDPVDFAKSCGVPSDIAAARHGTVRRCRRAALTREGGLCEACGNFTVTSDGKCNSSSCSPRISSA